MTVTLLVTNSLLLGNFKVHRRVNIIPSINPILSRFYLVLTFTPSVSKIQFYIITPPLPTLPTSSVQNFTRISPFSHAYLVTCPAHLITLNLIILISDEDYKLWSSWLRSFLYPTAMASLLRTKYSPWHGYLPHKTPLPYCMQRYMANCSRGDPQSRRETLFPRFCYLKHDRFGWMYKRF
jgi:hypothetical protein